MLRKTYCLGWGCEFVAVGVLGDGGGFACPYGKFSFSFFSSRTDGLDLCP